MKYFYDCEFAENGREIDLISIGIVAEDGRELYLESSEANWSQANDWVKANVLPYLQSYRKTDVDNIVEDDFTQSGCDAVSRATIREMIFNFCDRETYGKPEFWGYYSAYDHVALCQIFETMINLPKGWPMYTRDIKQWCDQLGNPQLPERGKDEHHALADARWNKRAWMFLRDYEYSLRSGADRRMKELLACEHGS